MVQLSSDRYEGQVYENGKVVTRPITGTFKQVVRRLATFLECSIDSIVIGAVIEE